MYLQRTQRARSERRSVLPWDEMFRAAIAAGLRPTEFWSLSLKEWRWLVAGDGHSLTAKDLSNLMKEYPDG